ncbi:hypothetical protein PG988_007838 [Apiospora saccharicola]
MDELADWVYPHHAMPVEYGWSMLRRRQVTTEESEPEPSYSSSKCWDYPSTSQPVPLHRFFLSNTAATFSPPASFQPFGLSDLHNSRPSAFRQPAAFRGLQQHNFDAHKHCVPHGSYLFNLAAAENVKAYQGYDSFIDDLHRCESLGNVLYNSHSGNTKGGTMPMQTETSRWALQPI